MEPKFHVDDMVIVLQGACEGEQGTVTEEIDAKASATWMYRVYLTDRDATWVYYEDALQGVAID